MSELKVNKISPRDGTAFTFGDSGDTFTVPAGANIVNSGTATGFGAAATWTKVASSGPDTNVSELIYTGMTEKDIWVRIRGLVSMSPAQAVKIWLKQSGSWITSGSNYHSSGYHSEATDAITRSQIIETSNWDPSPGTAMMPAAGGDASRHVQLDLYFPRPGNTTKHTMMYSNWHFSNDKRGKIGHAVCSYDANTSAIEGFSVYGANANWNFDSYDIYELT